MTENQPTKPVAPKEVPVGPSVKPAAPTETSTVPSVSDVEEKKKTLKQLVDYIKQL